METRQPGELYPSCRVSVSLRRKAQLVWEQRCPLNKRLFPMGHCGRQGVQRHREPPGAPGKCASECGRQELLQADTETKGQ